MSATALYFYLRDDGAVLASRRRGRMTSDRLRAIAAEHQDIVLDFAGVEALTPPFAQELFDAIHTIIGPGLDSGRLVVIVNANEDVLDTLKLVLESRSGTMAFRVGDQVELLSDSAPHLIELLEQAQKLRRFTAAELADSLDVALNTVHGRLKPLLESGVVGRERDPEASRGVRHVYRVVTVDDPAPEPATPARDVIEA
jgi:predicted transcriptional regulator